MIVDYPDLTHGNWGRNDRRNVLVSSCTFRPSQGARRPRLRIFLDEIGGALTDHHAGEIGIGVGDRRHDRGITDPEIFHAVDAQLLVDDRHGIGLGAHFASANAVKIAGVSGAGELRPIFVGVGENSSPQYRFIGSVAANRCTNFMAETMA